jgi:hypothetical protein
VVAGEPYVTCAIERLKNVPLCVHTHFRCSRTHCSEATIRDVQMEAGASGLRVAAHASWRKQNSQNRAKLNHTGRHLLSSSRTNVVGPLAASPSGSGGSKLGPVRSG